MSTTVSGWPFHLSVTNVLRLAYEMHTGDTNVLAPFASLDTPWWFDWPLQWQQNPGSRDGTLIC